MPPLPPPATRRQRRQQQPPTRTPSPAALAARAGGAGHLTQTAKKRVPAVNAQYMRRTPHQRLQVPTANAGGERRPPAKQTPPSDSTDTTRNRSATAHSRPPPQPAARSADPRQRQQTGAISAGSDRHFPVSEEPPAANAGGECDAPVKQRLLATNARSRPPPPPRRQQWDRSTTVKRHPPTNGARHKKAAPVTCARGACLASSGPLGHELQKAGAPPW